MKNFLIIGNNNYADSIQRILDCKNTSFTHNGVDYDHDVYDACCLNDTSVTFAKVWNALFKVEFGSDILTFSPTGPFSYQQTDELVRVDKILETKYDLVLLCMGAARNAGDNMRTYNYFLDKLKINQNKILLCVIDSITHTWIRDNLHVPELQTIHNKVDAVVELSSDVGYLLQEPNLAASEIAAINRVQACRRKELTAAIEAVLSKTDADTPDRIINTLQDVFIGMASAGIQFAPTY